MNVPRLDRHFWVVVSASGLVTGSVLLTTSTSGWLASPPPSPPTVT